MERDQATRFVHDLLKLMVAKKASDLFLTADFPPALTILNALTDEYPSPHAGILRETRPAETVATDAARRTEPHPPPQKPVALGDRWADGSHRRH